MAKVIELDQAAWAEWVATRPPAVQELCKRLPPDRLYRMRSTGKRVTLFLYCEDGTVTVSVTGEFNVVIFDRQVFGISPDDLEECDLPPRGELLGTGLTTDEDVDAFVEAIRPAILAERDEEPRS